jgi:hypothetical protein
MVTEDFGLVECILNMDGTMILPIMHNEWLFVTKTIYDPEVFWAMITALATVGLLGATIALVWIGIIPLVRNKRADLVERLRQDFLTSLVENILFLAGHNLLVFVREIQRTGMEGTAFFEIRRMDGNIFQQRLVQIVGDQRIIMTFEVEDHILSPLEEVAYYEEHGELDFEDAFRVFGTYFDICFSSREIQRYITWIRERKPDAYQRAERLYRRMNERDAADIS